MKKISYFTPAKVIISGEHSVVYGKPALVSAIDLGLKFSVIENNIISKDKNVLIISKIVKDYLIKNKIQFYNKPFSSKVSSNIPIGRGLGSSAAFSVAAVASFLEFFTKKSYEDKKEIINNLAYLAEKHFHKNPSGVDNSTSCFGGLLYYRKEFEFLKNISELNFKIPRKIESKLYLIDSGRPKEKTVDMVKNVRKLYGNNIKKCENLLNKAEKTTKRILISILKQDVDFLKKNILENQVILENLGVVSDKTKKLLTSLNKFGIGKITGAGGKKKDSGFILFLSENNKALEKHLKINNICYYNFKQDFKGLRKD